jgi:hypothetical protein
LGIADYFELRTYCGIGVDGIDLTAATDTHRCG